MRYVSTRGAAPVLDFADTLLAGLADDGGLYVPESWPTLGPGGRGDYFESQKEEIEMMWALWAKHKGKGKGGADRFNPLA